ncbi:MAG: terminase TerL endonuclease subunit [Dokdonella sp.]
MVKGEIIAGPIVRDACARHIRDLKTGRKRGLKFDNERADYALGFFPDVLRLNGGQFEGKPFNLDDSQAFIVGSLFGWLRQDGTRRFRVAYIEQGKGNGKSPLVAGIGLFGMAADGEQRAEVYAAATKKDQAMILFRDAVAMVDQSPVLNAALNRSGRDDKVWNLYHLKSSSFFRPISADKGQSGPRPHIGLIDELHEHKTRAVISMMSAGRKWRRQPLLIAITNSGHDRNSVCWEYHEMARKVCAGTVTDDTFFGFVCGMDPDDDPFTDEGCWAKANPLLGKTIELQYLRDEVNSARGMPSKESEVRRLNFCEWTEAANPWISGASWIAIEKAFDLDDIPDGEECIGGLDLSGTRDLTALALYFPRLKRAVLLFWIPGDGLRDRGLVDGVDYSLWVDQGFVNAPAGTAVDYGAVARAIGDVAGRFNLLRVAYDPYRMKYLQAEMDREDVSVPLISHGQGYRRATESGLWMTRSLELLEAAITDQTIEVATNPCLRWNAANAVVESDHQENRKLSKAKSNGRIDGIVALAMAIGAASDIEDEGDMDDWLSSMKKANQ